jgi:hypothetical protein
MQLFDGKTLKGWKFVEPDRRWAIRDGSLVCRGPASTLLLVERPREVISRNFELEIEAMGRPEHRAEVHILSACQGSSSAKVVVANRSPVPDDPQTWLQAGSIIGRRHIYKKLIPDGTWFRLNIAVRGRHFEVRLNGVLLVDFLDHECGIPDLGDATIALHCAGDSEVLFRKIQAHSISDKSVGTSDSEQPDVVERKILHHTGQGIPIIDCHVHLKGDLDLDGAQRHSRRHGIQYGVAVNCGKGFPVETDEAALAFCRDLSAQPVFVAMQAEGREWTSMFSQATAAAFDYIFTDSMTWSDRSGRRMRLWIPDEVGAIANPDDFMETLIARTQDILQREPIDIYANPTFLPAVIADNYGQLWTEQRMQRIIETAARNQVAIEINELYQIPSAKFIRLAKAAGCKFTLGSNNTGSADLRRSEYGLRIIEHCELGPNDFFLPGVTYSRAIDRKPGVLLV